MTEEDYELEDAEDEKEDRPAGSLTDWKTPPTLDDLKGDYTEASATRENQSTRVSNWLDNLHVTGKAKIKSRTGRSQFVPRLIRKQAEWRYTALSEPFLSSRDIFKVSPVSWEDKDRAHQNELVLNNQFNCKIDKQKFIDDYVRTATDEGTAIVKICWDFEEEQYQEEEPTYEYYENPDMAQVLQEVAELRQSNPSGYETDVPPELKAALEMSAEQGVPVEAAQVGVEMVTKTRTVHNRPDLEICDYRNITTDPTAKGNMSKARFVIHNYETSMDELKRDGRYSNLDKIESSDKDVLSAPDHTVEDGSFKFNDKARKQFTLHEYWGYWDIDGSGIVKPIVAAWVEGTLIRLEENPYPHKKIPFIMVQYLPVRHSNFGEPDGHLLEDNQKVAGAVSRGMIDLMARSANGQMGIRKDALDPTNQRKFDRGQDYQFNQTVDPRQGMYMHTYPEIPNSAQFMLQLQNNDAESMTGVKAFSAGLSGDALGESVGNGRSVLDAASKREAGILRRLAAGITEIGRMILSMNSEFLDEEEVVRITNEEFVEIRSDDLAGNFDLHLAISTAEEDSARAQELAFMLQTAAQSMDAGMRNRLLSEIARLRKMPELAKELAEYEPQPDPLEQEIKQLEIEKLKREIAKIESETIENQANAQLDQAKARELSSTADLKDLDFVEQESGVKQERDKELQGAQAAANIELEDRKHANRQSEMRNKGLQDYIKRKNSEK